MKRLISITTLALLVLFSMSGCKKSYTIKVKSNNDAWGTVTGSGTYKDGEIVAITAVPAQGYFFTCWNDGNTENPRVILVSGDAEYIATFSDTPGGGGGGTENALEISGSINANTVWPDRGEGVDYIIDGRLYVSGNALLTVEPGVTIMFTGVNGAIEVEENAGLRMVGTYDHPITLIGPANNPNPGAWQGVEVWSKRNDNQFEYVNFINGGSADALLRVYGKLTMKHCVVGYSESVGVSLEPDGIFTAFENNSFHHVSGYPLVLDTHEMVNYLGTGNTYSDVNSLFNMIKITDFWLAGDNKTVTYTNQGIPYFLTAGLHIDGTSTMKANAGVEFVLPYDQSVSIDDNALIQVDGTASQPVIFRGFNNENGYWEGIEIESERTANGGSYLTYCQILNAGDEYDDGALSTDEDTRLVLNNVSISGSIGYGLKVSIPVNWNTEQYDFANYHVTASGLTFANCAMGNIYESNKDQTFSSWPGNKKRK